ncbi:choice-of-anchor B domain-containing protein [Ulvibacter sp. MAR_2010_11]|uniref:choice-of-anchor B family protein n=1 Tax=Ulvibacter sp. MAR_2010_11 TaxID=1250229 RepID=UPI000C2B97C2|nr:choice-of-anchor B family protein [Ulvibacter sp. MAR_2010_11]PKA83383.1 choice-of-anchor B domain-containing protein [Ulvibacter sp. MAR_2010_11]
MLTKKLLFISLFLLNISIIIAQPCSGGIINNPGTANDYPCSGIDLVKYISASTMGAGEGQDSWGWTDTDGDGDEYAIVALDNGTAFVRITDNGVTNPVYLGRMPTFTGTSLWRDVKVYQNYAYIVSDSNGSHGVQIFDLTTLRTLTGTPTVTFDKNGAGRYSGVSSCHNIIINETTGYAYLLGCSTTNSGAPRILNLNVSKTSPTVAGNVSSSFGYCHDAQVIVYDGPDPDHQGKEILIGSFSGSDYVKILDVSNKSNITQISQVGYPNKYYTHQGWFTEDKRFFIVGDEVDEENIGGPTRTFVFDLQDLDNPVLFYTYQGQTNAIDHNGYVRGNRFYQANYAAGMRILKVDGLYDLDSFGNPNPSMTEVNYFDTFVPHNLASFNGTWNVYPFLNSGNLIVTGFGNESVSGDGGLFVVKDPNYDNVDPVAVCQPHTATLDASTGSVTISATDLDGGSTDNKGITKRTITNGQTTFTCADVGKTFNVTLTVEDDYGNKSSCVSVVTVAAATTIYLGSGIWSAGIPDMGSNARIFSDYNTSTAGNGNIDACTCEVDTGISLTVAAGDYINITQDITVNGTLVVEHTGSVVQTDALASVTNNGAINVELETPVLKTRDFMVMGSPMDAETRNGVFNSAFLVLSHTPANFIPHPGVPAGGTNFADNNGDFWSSYSGNITVGEGYIVRPQSGYTDPANHPYYMTYTQGTLNNGDVSRPIIFNGLGTNPDGTPNVLANPYASAISGYDLIDNNALINEVYFWEHLTPPSTAIPGHNSINFSMGDISMYNLSGGVKAANDPGSSTVPNGVISTGQGFGIKAFGAGSILFTNSMRLTSGNTTLRGANEEEIDRIRLSVSQVEYGIGSNTMIAFNPLATPGIDPGYDSNRLATAIALYSHLEDGSRQLGIQTREAFNGDIKISMGFASQVDAETSFVISIDNLEGEQISNAIVYLADNRENIVHNLSAGDYEFKSPIGTFNQRFTLLFEVEEEVIILGPDESKLMAISVYPNPSKNTVNIYSPYAPIENVEVYDIRGRRVVEIVNREEHNYQINLNSLETAIYFVKIFTDAGSITKKVIKE